MARAPESARHLARTRTAVTLGALHRYLVNPAHKHRFSTPSKWTHAAVERQAAQSLRYARGVMSSVVADTRGIARLTPLRGALESVQGRLGRLLGKADAGTLTNADAATATAIIDSIVAAAASSNIHVSPGLSPRFA